MDLTAFFKLSYGLYVISAPDGERRCGCVVNTFAQVTAEPAQVTVAVNKLVKKAVEKAAPASENAEN